MHKEMIEKLGKVAVLLGGESAERVISLQSGTAVLDALLREGVDAHAFDPATQSLDDIKQFDRAFIALHGRFGEDGGIQQVLDDVGVPYTGSGVKASAIGMDKLQTKTLWRDAGIATPNFALINAKSDFAAIEKTLGLPLFVKPANEGSSIGISKVNNTGEVEMAYQLAAEAGPLVMAESFINAGEYTVGILAGQALPIVKIVVKNEFYDYDAKYIQNDTAYLYPCGLSAEKEKQIQQEALHAFHVVGCCDWGRVDFLMDDKGHHYFIELNTVPGMTSHSLVPMAAKAAGMNFDALTMAILRLTLEEKVEGAKNVA
jgi:D-alanine-D-alanine ligase